MQTDVYVFVWTNKRLHERAHVNAYVCEAVVPERMAYGKTSSQAQLTYTVISGTHPHPKDMLIVYF